MAEFQKTQGIFFKLSEKLIQIKPLCNFIYSEEKETLQQPININIWILIFSVPQLTSTEMFHFTLHD